MSRFKIFWTVVRANSNRNKRWEKSMLKGRTEYRLRQAECREAFTRHSDSNSKFQKS